ncbi:hypothetical protein HID58_028823 [Brassica napus]|uniref:Uncharacterized protein n=1 Tax=Brassica napus TaxID=3708 RepID=A0ABQ8CCA2_BRANA|nr:hypothetical protein HID58_028823 [Brassica napus]
MVISMDLLQQDYDSGMTTAPVLIVKMMTPPALTPVVGHGLIMVAGSNSGDHGNGPDGAGTVMRQCKLTLR